MFRITIRIYSIKLDKFNASSELISKVVETEIEKLRKERTLPGEVNHPSTDGITGGIRYVRRISEC